jgi:hypothetical protein
MAAEQYLSRAFTRSLVDPTIPQRQCGQRAYCGRCRSCRRAFGDRYVAVTPSARDRAVARAAAQG